MTGEQHGRKSFRLPTTSARIDAETEAEFRFHIEERIEQFMAEGMTRRQAELEVEGRFGDYEAFRNLTRQIDEDTMHKRRRAERMRDIQRQVRYAARALLRAPSFSLIAFITLALGIGATTAIYAVLDTVVLRPLAYPHSEQLVSVLHPATVPGSGERKWGLSAGGYFQFRDKNHSFSNFAMFRNSGITVTNDGQAEMTQLALVTSTVFDVFQAKAYAGRLLSDDDDKPGAPDVVVLSYEFLQSRFGGDVSVVGKQLETSNGSYQIVGVSEPGLVLPMPGPFGSTANLAGFGVDVWMPIKENPAGPFHNSHPFVGVGRLKPGVTVEAAQRDLQEIFSHFTETVPNAYTKTFIDNYNFRVEASALRNAVLGPRIPRTLWMLFGAVTLVLLIAAANVSNLFLVRMEARRREAAIRTALGADRAGMATHYLSETLLLCLAAGACGVLIAAGGLKAMLAVAPTDIPRLAHVALSWRSAAVAIGIAIVLGLMLGVMPLLRGSIDLGVLRDGGRGLAGSHRQRAVRSGLVVGQVALALVLLSAAGLMLRSFGRLRNVRPGFDATGVLTFDVSLPFNEFKTREAALIFHREFARRVRALPYVTAVGSTSSVPLEDYGTGCTIVWRESRPYDVGQEPPCVSTPIAVPGFFETLKVPVDGRTPTWDDVDNRTQAVVITKALGDRLWPNESPIGKGIGSNGAESKVWYRIVGVIPELKAEALDKPPTEAVFYSATGLRPNAQTGALNDLSYMVRTTGGDPLELTSRVRAILAEMNPSVPFMDARSMEDVMTRSMARTSFMMILLGVSAVFALVLSAVGMYGVISYVVTQRRTEIGIRMALGADIARVVRMLLAQSVVLSSVGVAIGMAGAFVLNKLMVSMLFETSPADPLVLFAVVVLLLAIATVATLVPARRAARIDPAEAMRSV